MKTFLLSLVLAVSAFGQRGGSRPAPIHHPAPIVVNRPVVVAPYVGGYYGGYYEPYGYYPYSSTVVVHQPDPCKKEKLKDSNGKKHEILVCRQPDGSFKVVADADQLK